jgi:hypothetical protein
MRCRRTQDAICLALLTIAFVIDTAVNYATSTVEIQLQNSYKQYIVGCFSLLLVGVAVTLKVRSLLLAA